MSDLSPAAEAVLNAVTFSRYDVPYIACPKSIDQIRADAAEVLRAAVDQAIPLTKTPWGSTLVPVLTADESRSRLLAIAQELEPRE